MTRNRIATRRRAAGPQREPKPMPLTAKCRGCGKEEYVDRRCGLCQKCRLTAPILVVVDGPVAIS